MALFYVLQTISIPNYPAKLFWVNLMPFVNFNVDSYLPCGSRLKNEVNLHVYPRCLFSLIDSTCQVVNKIIRSPNRTNRPNRQTCNGSLY